MKTGEGLLRFERGAVVDQQAETDRGRDARATIPRSEHAVFSPSSTRDPLGVLDRQHEARLAHLVPLRISRMTQSPFAFYRGTAAIQAADFGQERNTGASIVICGDAHISNFGLFASPERSMVFDLNDFDEATVGPWEWDVKRLVTSVVVAARERGAATQQVREVAELAATAYRNSLRSSLELDATERFFRAASVKHAQRFSEETQRLVRATVKSSKKRTSARVIERITEIAPDGARNIIENPPVLTHVGPEIENRLSEIIDRYRETVSPDISLLLAQHVASDVARRVVGVGSVGTRCFIVVLTGPRGEPLILQVKEANRSVVNEFGEQAVLAVEGSSAQRMAEDHGYRVTTHQRILQAVSDPFLGNVTVGDFSFYVRQFRDRNVSFAVDEMSASAFNDYAVACGTILGRAHSRSSRAAFVAGYMGSGSVFTDAVVDWAHAYADQSYADYQELCTAVADGRYEAPDSQR
jgi:uncharacterized protein (DUF2252 family)